jgi:hypothetical protein
MPVIARLAKGNSRTMGACMNTGTQTKNTAPKKACHFNAIWGGKIFFAEVVDLGTAFSSRDIWVFSIVLGFWSNKVIVKIYLLNFIFLKIPQSYPPWGDIG